MLKTLIKKNQKLRMNIFFNNNKNIHKQTVSLKKITISMLPKQNTSIEDFLCCYTLIQIVTGFKPSILRAKKSISQLKQRKGIPIGIKITLRGQIKENFYTRLLWDILPKLKEIFISFKRKSLKQNTAWTFELKEPLLFSELHSFYSYYKTAPSLNFSFLFNSCFNEQNVFFAHLYKLPLKINKK